MLSRYYLFEQYFFLLLKLQVCSCLKQNSVICLLYYYDPIMSIDTMHCYYLHFRTQVACCETFRNISNNLIVHIYAKIHSMLCCLRMFGSVNEHERMSASCFVFLSMGTLMILFTTNDGLCLHALVYIRELWQTGPRDSRTGRFVCMALFFNLVTRPPWALKFTTI